MSNHLDGHTYYYLLDEFDIMHICSSGWTRCGISAMDMVQIEDSNFKKYELCGHCQVPEKRASVASKAKLVTEEEANEIQNN